MNKRLIIGFSSAFLVSQIALAQISKAPAIPTRAKGAGAASKSAYVNMTEPGKLRIEVKPGLISGRNVDSSGRFFPATITHESSGQNLGLELSLGLPRNTETQPQIDLFLRTGYTTVTTKGSAMVSGQSISGTQEMKGWRDISVGADIALPLTSQVNVIGALGAELSPETSKSKYSSGSSTSEQNVASGGQSLLTGLGIEVNPSKAPISFGVLGEAEFTGDRKAEDFRNGVLEEKRTSQGGNRLKGQIFAEAQIKQSRIGAALGMIEYGESTRESTDVETGRVSYGSSIPVRQNIGKVYAHLVASENFVFKPSFTYMEMNDPKHHNLEFDQDTLVELGAAVSF